MLLLLTQLEVYYNKHEPLTGLTAEQSATTVRWNLNKTTLLTFLQAHPTYMICSMTLNTLCLRREKNKEQRNILIH